MEFTIPCFLLGLILGLIFNYHNTKEIVRDTINELKYEESIDDEEDELEPWEEDPDWWRKI